MGLVLTSSSPQLTGRRQRSFFGRPSSWILLAVIGVLFFYVAVRAFPSLLGWYWYPEIKSLFYEELGFSDAWSSLFAVIGSFFYAVVWVPLLWWVLRVSFWKFNLRHLTFAFFGWIFIYGLIPLVHVIGLQVGTDACFNQRTGKPLKWYVIRPGGEIILSDSVGKDPITQRDKLQVTPQICRVVELQRRGIRPKELSGDPRSMKFFDEVSGQARVWYYRSPDGRIDLFDAEGMHPVVGEPLVPINKDVVQESQARAAAMQADVQRAKQLEAVRAEALTKEKTRLELAELFGVNTYSDGVIILGANSKQRDELSGQAVKALLSALAVSLRRKNLSVDEFKPRVYSAGHYDSLMTGNVEILREIGLIQKMRAALISIVDASCRTGLEAPAVVACTISVQGRLVTRNGNTSLRRWSEIGAGTSTAQALTRAAELLIERNPDLLDGV